MSDVLALIVVLFFVVCIPLIIVLHYVTKWKQRREFSVDDEQMLEDLWDLAQRVEDRIDALERILDSDERDWRKT